MLDELRKVFNRIDSFQQNTDAWWQDFMPREYFSEKLWPDADEPDAYLFLDSYAASGPDCENFLNEVFVRMLDERTDPHTWWRFPVTRCGEFGYAQREHLTSKERNALFIAQ